MDDRQRVAATLATLAMLALLGWLEMPPWQRELVKRTARRRAYLILHRLARASGHRAMGDELSGRKVEAEAGYEWTHKLSRIRDAL